MSDQKVHNLQLVYSEPCLPCCEGGINLIAVCYSRTGTGQLCGWSGFPDPTWDEDNPGLWAGQGRKWRTMTHDGTLTSDLHFEDVTCDNTPSRYLSEEWRGSSTIDCSGLVSNSETRACVGPDPTVCTPWEPIPLVPQTPTDCNPGLAILFDHSRTFALTVMTDTGCGCDTSGSYPINVTGTRTITLTDEVFPYDVLTGEPEILSLCCASSLSFDLTSPQSTGPINFEVTAVRILLIFFAAPNTNYEVTLNFTHTNGITSNSESVTLLATTDNEGAWAFYYTIPQPRSGWERCFNGGIVELFAE